MTTAAAMLLAAGSVEIEAAAAPATPRVNIVAYTGGLMTVSGWGLLRLGAFSETLAFELVSYQFQTPRTLGQLL